MATLKATELENSVYGDAALAFDPLSSKGIFTIYQAYLRHYYATEQRWPDASFWQRRRTIFPTR